MGVRIGGGVGPVSVGTSVNSRDAGGCLAFIMYAVAIALVIFVVVTLSPLAIIAFGLWGWVTWEKTTGWAVLAAAITLTGVAFGAWLWPNEYVFMKYREDVPEMVGKSPRDARSDLNDAGFKDVRFLDNGPGSEGYCEVEKQSLKGSADQRRPVVLTIRCK